LCIYINQCSNINSGGTRSSFHVILFLTTNLSDEQDDHDCRPMFTCPTFVGVMDPSSKSAEDSTASCSKTRCYYVCGSIVPFDEDVTHEFKGHKNLSEEEIPPWTQIANTDRRTRGPVSK